MVRLPASDGSAISRQQTQTRRHAADGRVPPAKGANSCQRTVHDADEFGGVAGIAILLQPAFGLVRNKPGAVPVCLRRRIEARHLAQVSVDQDFFGGAARISRLAPHVAGKRHLLHAAVDAGLFVKAVLREGVLQDHAGPSIAVEVGPLLPSTVAGERGGGGEGVAIVSIRPEPVTVHVNLGGGADRAGHGFGVWGVIGELPWEVTLGLTAAFSLAPPRAVARGVTSGRGRPRIGR